jgi:hypothetical protein
MGGGCPIFSNRQKQAKSLCVYKVCNMDDNDGCFNVARLFLGIRTPVIHCKKTCAREGSKEWIQNR